jgi:hypothetical protein
MSFPPTDEQKQRAKLAALAKYKEAKKLYKEAIDTDGSFELNGTKAARWERTKERMNFLFFKICHLLGYAELEKKFLENAQNNTCEEFLILKLENEEAFKMITFDDSTTKNDFIPKWKRKSIAKTILKIIKLIFNHWTSYHFAFVKVHK